MFDGDLGDYKKRLESAINAALADSPHINQAIQDIRDRGFDVFLIVEATVGFNRQDAQGVAESASGATELDLTSQDASFLRRFGIRPD